MKGNYSYVRPREQLYTPNGLKKLRRIYKSLMPYMRTYKEDILGFWEEETHAFTLQRMPFRIKDIQYETTCGHPYCVFKHGVMEPGTYRVSIEKLSNFDDVEEAEKVWNTKIPLAPLHKNTSAWETCKLFLELIFSGPRCIRY